MRTHNPDAKRLGCVEPTATNEGNKEQGEPKAEEGLEDEAPNSDVNPSGRVRRQKGWWKRGVVETKSNTVHMTAWVHKECDIKG